MHFLFIIYGFFLKNKIGITYLKISTIANVIILIIAYPFLSSDLFNYLFDAKIILTYHLSPYTHKALDFPADDWIRFMRWTHRYTPYGPFWLTLSLFPALLGFGKFLLNFLMFKIFIGSFHLINTYLIYKILKKINPEKILFGTAFYSLNPLFLTEGVINAHNDIVLLSFILLAIYLFSANKYFFSSLILLLGSLLKYIPILNIPWLMLAFIRNKKINDTTFIILNLITLIIFTLIYSTFGIKVPFVSSNSTQVQFQPWYLFWTIPLVSLLKSRLLVSLSLVLSFSVLLRYLPFIYFGDWSHQGTVQFMSLISFIPAIVFTLLYLYKFK